MTATKAVTATGAEHAADEAAGEVVFCSDGLEPLPIPVRRPPPTSQQEKSTDDEDVVDYTSNGISPADAFQMFAGHMYPPPSGSSQQQEAGGKSSFAKESPLDRLGRLQRELEELEQEVSALSTGSSSDEKNNPIMNTVQEFRERLQSQKIPNQADWTAQMEQTVTSLSSTEAPEMEATATAKTTKATAALEERLRRLEALVGEPSVQTTGSKNLAERCIAMEKATAHLDAAATTAVAKKAKVIRQDLEAAAKARNKFIAASSNNRGAEDGKTIASLHEAFQQLSGMSQHLPVLAGRCQALAQQHAETATWAARLASAEQTVASMRQQLTSTEEAVGQLEKGLKENAIQMQDNMKTLDEKMNKILPS